MVNAGYPNKQGFLAPYRGTQYHLPEFQQVGARGKEEQFNMLHSSLRNVIERCFSVLKQRWKMLDMMAPFSFQKQVKIIIAAMTLHNFIVEQNMSDELLSQFS